MPLTHDGSTEPSELVACLRGPDGNQLNSFPLGTAQTKISEESSGSLRESCSLAGQGGLYACIRVGTTDRLVL